MKLGLTWDEQVSLMESRGLVIADQKACVGFLSANSYYRFSGYARYFQPAPHEGDDRFLADVSFDDIRAIYKADEAVRTLLIRQLSLAELLVRTHVAHVIACDYGPRGDYLKESFYVDVGEETATVDSCLRDIERSKDRHILHYKKQRDLSHSFMSLPVWSAAEAWSFGTLSKCLERGAQGKLVDKVAASAGIAKAGFAYRVRSLVYLRNRCAHHGRLWHHSLIDAGPTPNNVRVKAKRLAGQFAPRSVIDAVASLDDIVDRGKSGPPVLPDIVERYQENSIFWAGLTVPSNPRDNRSS